MSNHRKATTFHKVTQHIMCVMFFPCELRMSMDVCRDGAELIICVRDGLVDRQNDSRKEFIPDKGRRGPRYVCALHDGWTAGYMEGLYEMWGYATREDNSRIGSKLASTTVLIFPRIVLGCRPGNGYTPHRYSNESSGPTCCFI
jgi:hypothetical protein